MTISSRKSKGINYEKEGINAVSSNYIFGNRMWRY